MQRNILTESTPYGGTHRSVAGLPFIGLPFRFNYQQSFNVDIPKDFDESFFDWSGVLSAGGHMFVSFTSRVNSSSTETSDGRAAAL